MIKFIVALFFFMPLLGTSQSSINIKVEGIKDIKGKLYIGLYNGKESFRDTDHVFASQIVPVEADTLITSLPDIPAGEYALTLFHDKNDNGKLDTNFLGIPKEKYGFSNNPKVRFKAPGFDKCRFTVEGDTEVSIKMK